MIVILKPGEKVTHETVMAKLPGDMAKLYHTLVATPGTIEPLSTLASIQVELDTLRDTVGRLGLEVVSLRKKVRKLTAS